MLQFWNKMNSWLCKGKNKSWLFCWEDIINIIKILKLLSKAILFFKNWKYLPLPCNTSGWLNFNFPLLQTRYSFKEDHSDFNLISPHSNPPLLSFAVLRFELRAYNLSHSTSPFSWFFFFEIRSRTIYPGWLQPLPPEKLGLQAWATGAQLPPFLMYTFSAMFS
jgi:hypothetical protein